MAGLLLLQVPPEPVVVNVPDVPAQSVAGPDTVPGVGELVTVTGVPVPALPQVPDTE